MRASIYRALFFMRGLLPLAAIVAVALIVPASASAICTEGATCGVPKTPGTIVTEKNRPNFKGWAYVRGLGICPAGVQCVWAGELQVPAWMWTGSAWKKKVRNTGTKVYAWPWTASWVWTWTSATGWYAMQTDRIVIPTNSCWDYSAWRFKCMIAM
jgi:hypothetical protein